MVPTVEDPPAMSLTSQLTAVLTVPLTVAVNERVAPSPTVAVVGLTATVIGAVLTVTATEFPVMLPLPG